MQVPKMVDKPYRLPIPVRGLFLYKILLFLLKLIPGVKLQNSFYKKEIILQKFYNPKTCKKELHILWGPTAIPVIIMAVTKKLEVIAIKQFRYAAEYANEFFKCKLNSVITELPGGCPKFGEESFLETLRKELKEETGYITGDILDLGLNFFEPSTRFTPYRACIAMNCELYQQELDLDMTEHIEMELIPIQEWLNKIQRKEIYDSKTIAVTFLSLTHLGIKFKFPKPISY